jgi:CHAD domain-containing protein
MNSAVGIPGNQANGQSHAHRSRLTEWRQLLARCGRKPTRKSVHALRVVTLRVLADLEYRMGESGTETPEMKAVVRWCRQAEKLRRAMSSVREGDVWISKLDKLRASLNSTEDYVPRSNRELHRQIDNLEDRLKQKRRSWEKKLVVAIEDRRNRLDRLSKEIETVVEGSGTHAAGAVSPRIGEEFAEVAAEFRALDQNNLHEFRKRIKKVRYLAEIFAGADPEAGHQAALLRKMQSGIGEWHDWQQLARKGRESGELGQLLETLAAESLARALDLCERSTKRMLKANYGNDASQTVPKKPPARSIDPAMEINRKLVA